MVGGVLASAFLGATQQRIRGTSETAAPADSCAPFNKRPLGSQMEEMGLVEDGAEP